MVSSEPLLLPVSLEGEFSTSMKEMIGGCCVCSDERGWAENPLVYCDGHGCNVAVHQGEWAGGPRSPPGVPVPRARVRVPIGPSWHPQSRFPACRPACSPIWAGLSSRASPSFPSREASYAVTSCVLTGRDEERPFPFFVSSPSPRTSQCLCFPVLCTLLTASPTAIWRLLKTPVFFIIFSFFFAEFCPSLCPGSCCFVSSQFLPSLLCPS